MREEMTFDERRIYVQSVQSAFQFKAKTRRDLTNAEWYLVDRWIRAGVPLVSVLRGLAEFEGQPRRLEACVNSVERVEAYRQKALS